MRDHCGGEGGRCNNGDNNILLHFRTWKTWPKVLRMGVGYLEQLHTNIILYKYILVKGLIIA